MKLIRWILGRIILLVDALTAPKPMQRPTEKQKEVDTQTQQMKLYQYLACPFCVKARRVIRRLGLDIETRDAKRNPDWMQELSSEGGKVQVPCLKIDHQDGRVEWMYESDAIIQYLEGRFAH